MKVYFDSSAFVKLLVEEPESSAVEEAAEETKVLATCSLTLAESHSALIRAHKGKRLSTQTYRDAVKLLEGVWTDTYVINVTQEIVDRACELIKKYTLRAYDGIQLSAALSLKGGSSETAFYCFDRELKEAAGKERLLVTIHHPHSST